jgi:hypothetical protein
VKDNIHVRIILFFSEFSLNEVQSSKLKLLFQDFFGEAANDDTVSKIIIGINVAMGIICNLLFIISVIYAIALMWMVIFPTSILKVCVPPRNLRKFP